MGDIRKFRREFGAGVVVVVDGGGGGRQKEVVGSCWSEWYRMFGWMRMMRKRQYAEVEGESSVRGEDEGDGEVWRRSTAHKSEVMGLPGVMDPHCKLILPLPPCLPPSTR